MSATTSTPRRSLLVRIAIALSLVAATLVAVTWMDADVPASASGGTNTCSGSFAINETLPNGGQWIMCWEKRANEGIVLSAVQYVAPGQAARLVMGRMYLGQIHVPYHDNGARYHDVSDYGMGEYMVALGTADCPGGSLLSDGSANVLCKQVQLTGTDYKSSTAQRQGYQLSLFSSSQIGAYNYLVKWVFNDDGTITPTVGATGALQRVDTTSAGHNWPLAPSRFGISHLHNYYWNLDFDLGGATNDVVEQFDTNATSGTRTAATLARTTYTTETAARVNPSTFRTWFIKDSSITNSDGHNIGYELIPSADTWRGPTNEPWLQNDVYVVRQKDCEKYASRNPTIGGCAPDLSAFANGESLAGDISIWYGTSFNHVPRDEDDPRMHAHYTSFSLVPRDLTATNLMAAGTVTTTSTTTTTAAPTTTTTTTTTTLPPTTTTTTVVPGGNNNNIANATNLSTLPVSSSTNTAAYTMEAQDPNTACSWNRSKSAWYRFTSPVTRTVNATTIGSSFDTVMQVHTGTPPSLTAIGCNDDTAGQLHSRVSFQATAGTTYWIMVASYANSAGGNLVLGLS